MTKDSLDVFLGLDAVDDVTVVGLRFSVDPDVGTHGAEIKAAVVRVA